MPLRERSRTDPDEAHPAENRKVGGSIPSLPTVLGQLIEVRPVLPSKGSPEIGVISWAIALSIAAAQTKARRGGREGLGHSAAGLRRSGCVIATGIQRTGASTHTG
jgi:hypothetical protein